jgi:phosphatidylserine/phosphatidylglycerophosphate/cardiolipin synthase-like enzyme
VVHNVKIQNNVHNKGIIVDGKAVVVSSQNWSTDGTLYNRDVGVIIYNKAAAQYFQKIFLHDWDHLAEQKSSDD